MPTELFFNLCDVKRRTSSGQNGYGEEVYTYPTIYTNQICRIEEYNEETQYRDSGQRVKNSTKIYFPATVALIDQDEIYVSSVLLGKISGVNTALAFDGTVDHFEADIENP